MAQVQLRGRDIWWLCVAVLFGLLFALNVLAVFVLVLRGPRINLLVAPVSLVFTYWFAMGAWLRTTWGRPRLERTVPPGPPVLSSRRAGLLLAIAAGCIVAAAIALAVQISQAH